MKVPDLKRTIMEMSCVDGEVKKQARNLKKADLIQQILKLEGNVADCPQIKTLLASK